MDVSRARTRGGKLILGDERDELMAPGLRPVKREQRRC